MHRTTLLAALPALLASLAPAQPAPSPGPAAPPAAQEVAATDHALVESYDAGGFWGDVAIARNGVIEYAEGFGPADDAWNPITADSLFDVGSVTKQFTAAAIMKLEMQGELSTQDTVSKFFPLAGGRADLVTLHHLLTHTSGISDMDALQHLGFPDRNEAVRIAMAAPEHSPPGERFAYCNAGYVVLAAVIEEASGQTFENYLRESLFKPAGMTSTGFLDGIGLDPTRQVTRATRMLGPGPGQDAQGVRRVPLFSSPDGEPWAWGLRGAGGGLTCLPGWVRRHRRVRVWVQAKLIFNQLRADRRRALAA